jgi:hypothetical protein
VDLTGAQRPLLASSDVDVSINDLQKPARKFDRLIHGVEKNTQHYHYENSERINPIFCMKSGIMGRHVVSFFSPVERITTRAQVARVRAEADVGQPTAVWQLRRTDRAVSEQNCSLE